MPTPLLETKLYVPRSPRGLVPRPRLGERLDRGTASKLTLISAPAGFGKTTLLAEWLTARPPDRSRAVAWLSLDRRRQRPADVLDLCDRRAANGRRPRSAPARSRCWTRLSRRRSTPR